MEAIVSRVEHLSRLRRQYQERCRERHEALEVLRNRRAGRPLIERLGLAGEALTRREPANPDEAFSAGGRELPDDGRGDDRRRDGGPDARRGRPARGVGQRPVPERTPPADDAPGQRGDGSSGDGPAVPVRGPGRRDLPSGGPDPGQPPRGEPEPDPDPNPNPNPFQLIEDEQAARARLDAARDHVRSLFW